MLRRGCGVFLLAVLLGAVPPAGALPRSQDHVDRPGPVAAVLMDVRTGRVLDAREIHRRMPPASTTKIVTALVAIERLHPGVVITIGRRAAAVRTGSVIGLEAGARWTVDDLLHAVMLRSANDAAVALAEGVAGSVEGFSALMNARARRAGARDTRFVNPHGLDEPAQYTTAYDLAAVTRAALGSPRFAAMVRAPAYVLARPGRTETLVNRNLFLSSYPGGDGVKTGMTAAAGFTFVGSATRNGWQLIAVVLRSQDVYGDAARLLDFGFQTFVPRRLAARGEPVAARTVGEPARRLIAVVPAEVHAVVRRGAEVSSRVTWRPDLQPPIAAGDRVGNVRFVEDGETIATSPLVAARDVGR